jgi:hypothetical protein
MATDMPPPLDDCIAGRHTDTALEVRGEGGGRMPWPGLFGPFRFAAIVSG